MLPIFKLTCPCGAPLRVSADVFTGIDWRRQDGEDFHTAVDLSASRLLTGHHPLERSSLPGVRISCPACDRAVMVCMALVVETWATTEDVSSRLVGQRSFQLIEGAGQGEPGGCPCEGCEGVGAMCEGCGDYDAWASGASVVASSEDD